MPSPIEIAVETYIRVASERDPQARKAMLDKCWADDGRLVTRGGELRGRDAVAEMFDRFFADANVLGVRVLAIDARGSTFRFRAMTDFRDGTSTEVFDAGQIDADGRISLLLTFAGPLG